MNTEYIALSENSRVADALQPRRASRTCTKI